MNLRTIFPTLYRLSMGWVLSRQRPCNVAAFHVGRCGSRVLGDLLNQHSRIVWDGELFSPGRLAGIEARWPRLTRDHVKILRLRMTLAGRRCYGFETQPTQLQRLNISVPDYVQKLEGLGFNRFILLHRKNYLRRIVSITMAHQTSRWHLASGESPPSERVKLDVNELSLNWGPDTHKRSLIAHLEHAEQCISELKASLQNRESLFLTYEDDIQQNPQVGYRRVCEFIGVDVQPVTVRFNKTNTRDLSDVLTNFSEVKQSLQETSFEWMLYS